MPSVAPNSLISVSGSRSSSGVRRRQSTAISTSASLAAALAVSKSYSGQHIYQSSIQRLSDFHQSNQPAERKRRLQTRIREIYSRIKREHRAKNWSQLQRLLSTNKELLSYQLAYAKAANMNACSGRLLAPPTFSMDIDSVSDAKMSTPASPFQSYDAQVSPPLLAEPVEIPQLYSQMGKFEARIAGKLARVGLTILPQVSHGHLYIIF
ncbi:unnamed protein product [Protopolystoma xenopodis]|uniref:Uncharacterized protein n=1 Tax=Protopolystoma xenopodis TaxID=117903 RepID=A0A3S5A1T1_9PLAT|nr:unnamed protein product [Protopolystoma xenopodis]